MSKPIISWLNSTLDPLTKIQFSSAAGSMSAVVADTESLVVSVAIANNFVKGTATATAVDDATGCYLKITAADGTNNAPIVNERWVNAKCTTAGDASYTAIGVLNSSEVHLNITSGDVTKPQTISGAANDGTVEGTGLRNVAKVDMMAKPDLNTVATGGLQQFKFMLVYSYGAA